MKYLLSRRFALTSSSTLHRQMTSSTQSSQSLDADHLGLIADLMDMGRCVLVLGPRLSTIFEQGRDLPLHHQLARELAAELAKTPGMALPDLHDLALVCTAWQKQMAGGRLLLERFVGRFYRQQTEPGEALRQIPHLPFRIILNTTPDGLLQAAFKKEGKLFQEGYYRMGETQRDEFDERSRLPFLYSLFGKVLDKDVDKLVLTQQDQLRYLDSVQGVGKETRLPPALRNAMQDCKGFLFLGFDFEDWYLRVLLHILNFSREEQAQAVYGLHTGLTDQELPVPTALYFSNQYRFTFFPQVAPLDLLRQLRQRYEALGMPNVAGAKPALRLLYLHAQADEPIRVQLDKALSRLKAAHGIEAVSIHDLAPGDDVEQARHLALAEANLIVPLLSADFFAEAWLPALAEQALQRHGAERVRCAAIYARDVHGGTELFVRKGIPILPAEDLPLSDFANPDKALQKITAGLEKIIEGML